MFILVYIPQFRMSTKIDPEILRISAVVDLYYTLRGERNGLH